MPIIGGTIDLKYVFINFSLEKLLSPLDTDTAGMSMKFLVKSILY